MVKELIYNYYKNKRHENYNSGISFGPSYLTKCKRQIFYDKTRAEKTNPMSEASIVKTTMGNAVHEKIQDVLKEIGIYIEGEVFKEIEWGGVKWKYRIDGRLKVGEHGYIIEIKSSYATGLRMIEKGAREEDELQLLLYMIFEKNERGVILYIGRDTGYMIEYAYSLESLKAKYRDCMSNKLIELRELEKRIKGNEIPLRDHKIVLKNNKGVITNEFAKDKKKYKSDWQCSYCSYYDLCWKKELKEIKKYNFYIDGKYS